MSWNIKPGEFLESLGWKYKKRGVWLTMGRCPFCNGGSSGDTFTFAVHHIDGNYFCHRGKCGEAGSFWKLIETVGQNPRDFWNKEKKQKRFIYR